KAYGTDDNAVCDFTRFARLDAPGCRFFPAPVGISAAGRIGEAGSRKLYGGRGLKTLKGDNRTGRAARAQAQVRQRPDAALAWRGGRIFYLDSNLNRNNQTTRK